MTTQVYFKMGFTWRQLFLSLTATLFALCAVDGYSTGAPTSPRVCASMLPGHGAEIQTSPMPYTVEVMPVRSGTALSVTIVANSGRTFTGFMLQARNAVNRNQILEGIFSEDKQSQIKSCNSNKANTLTHRSGLPKTRVESVWTPPDSFMGEVVLRVTIVETKETYWTEQDSNVLRIRNGKVVENQKFMSNGEEANNDVNVDNNVREDGQSVPANSQKTTSNVILNYSVCDYKFCHGFGQTDNCVATKSCEMLLSGGYVNKEEGVTEFELSAVPKGDSHLNKYFSMAFSTDTKMGDDLVTDCYVTSEGKVKLGSSVNVGKNNELNDEFKDSLNSIQSSYTNGVVTCKWKSNRKRTVKGKEWDMLNNKYHIFLAMGDLEDDTGTKSYHESMRLASNNPIALEEVGAISVSDPIYLVRIHGAFMVIAWIGTVSLGIMFARYYKVTWVNSTLCGVKIWFAFHRGLMVISVILMVIAQLCIFTYLKEYRFGLHQILGSLAFVLALLNPVGALLRPHPEASNRWVFNWAHWAGGNAGHITAIVAIFLSTTLSLADLPKPFLWTIISFVIFYVITHLILQFHTFLMQNRKTHDIALQDMSRGSDDPDMGTDGPGTGFRRFILGIYCVGVLAFVIAMVSMITLPKSTLEMMAIT